MRTLTHLLLSICLVTSITACSTTTQDKHHATAAHPAAKSAHGQAHWDYEDGAHGPANWSKLDCPVLLVQGLQDRVFYDPAIVAELTATLPNAARVDVPDAGHMLPAELPEALLNALDGFPE